MFCAVFLAVAPAGAQSLEVTGEATLLAEGDWMQPRWSPRGDVIAFAGRNYSGLYVIPADGGDVTQLSDEPAAGYGAQWSHDGSAILARVAAVDGVRRQHAVKVFEVDTGDEHLLTEYQPTMRSLPRWMPDGSRVLLHDRGRLEVLDAGEVVAPKANTATEAVVFDQNGALAVASEADPSPRVLHRPSHGSILRLATSADGSMVAFEVFGGGLHVMNADGSNHVEIGRGEAARFSPDGEWIVFMRASDDGHLITGSDLWAARTDGSLVVRLTDTPDRLEMNPDWSPNGDAIVYDDRGSIYVIPVQAN